MIDREALKVACEAAYMSAPRNKPYRLVSAIARQNIERATEAAITAYLTSAGEGSVPVGWLYTSEEHDCEFSLQHPVESAEYPDAENIRSATATNLLAELMSAWEELDETRRIAGNAGSPSLLASRRQEANIDVLEWLARTVEDLEQVYKAYGAGKEITVTVGNMIVLRGAKDALAAARAAAPHPPRQDGAREGELSQQFAETIDWIDQAGVVSDGQLETLHKACDRLNFLEATSTPAPDEAVEAEREACAKVVEDYGWLGPSERDTLMAIAQIIRARSRRDVGGGV